MTSLTTVRRTSSSLASWGIYYAYGNRRLPSKFSQLLVVVSPMLQSACRNDSSFVSVGDLLFLDNGKYTRINFVPQYSTRIAPLWCQYYTKRLRSVRSTLSCLPMSSMRTSGLALLLICWLTLLEYHLYKNSTHACMRACSHVSMHEHIQGDYS